MSNKFQLIEALNWKHKLITNTGIECQSIYKLGIKTCKSKNSRTKIKESLFGQNGSLEKVISIYMNKSKQDVQQIL